MSNKLDKPSELEQLLRRIYFTFRISGTPSNYDFNDNPK
jgi:hypothetical protein